MYKTEDIMNLHETLVCELGELSKKEKISSADIELVDTLSHAAKNLEKVAEYLTDREQGTDSSYGRYYGRPYYADYRRENERRYGRDYDHYGHSEKDRMVEDFAKMLNASSKDEKEDIIRKVMEHF